MTRPHRRAGYAYAQARLREQIDRALENPPEVGTPEAETLAYKMALLEVFEANDDVNVEIEEWEFPS